MSDGKLVFVSCAHEYRELLDRDVVPVLEQFGGRQIALLDPESVVAFSGGTPSDRSVPDSPCAATEYDRNGL